MSKIIGLGKFSTEIEKEIMTKGYHIYNYALPKESYPNLFNNSNIPEKIIIGNVYALRLFVRIKSGLTDSIDSGLIDAKILRKRKDVYVAEILTLLPQGFPLRTGQKIDIKKEEILYEQDMKSIS